VIDDIDANKHKLRIKSLNVFSVNSMTSIMSHLL